MSETSQYPSIALKSVDQTSCSNLQLDGDEEKMRTSMRIRAQKLMNKLKDEISVQNEVNTMLLIELDDLDKRPTADRVNDIIKQQSDNMAKLHSLYNQYKDVIIEPDKPISIEIDRITHDIEVIIEKAEQLASSKQSMSVRSVSPVPSVAPSTSRSNKPDGSIFSTANSRHTAHASTVRTNSRHSSINSRHSSINSRHSSIRSKSSSLLRLKLKEAEANRVAKEAELRAELEAHLVEEELAELERKKRNKLKEIKLKAAIEIETKRQQVFQKALAEEMSDSVLLTARCPNPWSIEKSATQDSVQAASPNLQLSNGYETQPISTIKRTNDRSVALSNNHKVLDTFTSAATANSNSESNAGLAEAIVAATQMSRLPPPEPFVFAGDSLQFSDWMVSFEGLVGNKRCSNIEKLHYLRQYISGPAKEAINGYFQLQADDAYDKAKAVLQKRYGDPHTISDAFRDKIECWPTIQPNDGEGLRRFADFLQQCEVARSSIPNLDILDDSRENRRILAKVPNFIMRGWVRHERDMRTRKGKEPKFSDLCQFVADEAELLCSPLVPKREVKVQNKEKENAATTESKRNKTVANKQKHVAFKTNNSESQEVSESKINCLYCKKNNHTTRKCYFLGKVDSSKQREFIKEKSLCFKCLVSGHSYKNCEAKLVCNTCKQPHATAVHNMHENRKQKAPPEHDEAGKGTENKTTSKEQLPSKPASKTQENKQGVSNNTKSKLQKNNTYSLSMTVPVWVSSSNEPFKETLVYALLDSQSDTSFITTSLANTINTEKANETLELTTMTSNDEKLHCQTVHNLRIRGHKGQKVIDLPNVYTRDQIPAKRKHIPTVDDVRQWPHLQQIAKDLISDRDLPIGLLIGYNCPQVFIPRHTAKGADTEPFGILTDLGWVVMGQKGAKATSQSSAITHVVACSSQDLPHDTNRKCVTFKCHSNSDDSDRVINALERDFQETTTPTKAVSIDDSSFIDLMKREIAVVDGYVTMPLPFRVKPPANSSYDTAFMRFSGLRKKFKKDAKYAEQYKAFINDIIQKREAERVPEDERSNPNSWYIPHFGVFHPKKPGKIRVVFDGSAKTKGLALNDFLFQGPDHLNSLFGILLRFRQENVGVTCDIERMFHQFRVTCKHRDFLRFLWLDENGAVVPYRMNVHLFGAKSSPACATYGLRYLAQKTLANKNVSSSTANFITQNFYVDDGIVSLPSSNQALDIIAEASQLCQGGNIRLHKWLSNNREVMEKVPKTEQASSLQDLDLKTDVLPIERTLSILWNADIDCFLFKVNLESKPSTRRGILSNIASVYDPLGFIAPFILVGKQILQKMCHDNKGWDEPLDTQTLEEWERWKNELQDLEKINVPRCIKPDNFGKVCQTELHTFSDASTTGYGQCTYLRLVDSRKRVHVSLLASKARVAPIKPVTIPRLELQAASGAASLAQTISRELDMNQVPHYYYTDSQIVLSYIKNTEKRYHTFVANRVGQIHEKTSPDQWFYISTKNNPADFASRGASPTKLTSSEWFTGPMFLWKHHLELPTQPSINPIPNDPEAKRVSLNTNQGFSSINERICRFSDLNKLLRIVKMLKIKLGKTKVDDAHNNKQKAMYALVHATQGEYFSAEMQDLSNGRAVSGTSSIFNLNPFLDSEGLLRVGGRLQQCTTMSFEERHPLLLPKGSHLSLLIIAHFHAKVAHQGPNQTLAKIRAQGYWLIKGKSAVSSWTRSCTTCRKIRGKPVVPQMATLPTHRINEAPPFTHCGIDCFGPFVAKDGRKEAKRYGLLVTCMASRAVHLELLEDMTSDCFINALRTIVAIRGPIKTVYCDQGSNFVGAVSELKDTSQKPLKAMEIEFVFNPPQSSNMGGVWERNIRTIRNIFNGLGKAHGGRLSTSAWRTVFYEAMAIINSRPLGDITSDEVPLTSNMLLTMKSEVVLPPPGKFENSDIYSRKRWRAVQHIANQFWQRWRKEYLQNLQVRQKWVRDRPEVRVSDLVLVEVNDHENARNEWKMGKIVECFRSHDQVIRSVKILIGNHRYMKNPDKRQYLVRPVSKIVVLLSHTENE